MKPKQGTRSAKKSSPSAGSKKRSSVKPSVAHRAKTLAKEVGVRKTKVDVGVCERCADVFVELLNTFNDNVIELNKIAETVDGGWDAALESNVEFNRFLGSSITADEIMKEHFPKEYALLEKEKSE